MDAISMTPTASLMMPETVSSSAQRGKSAEMAQQFESLILSQLLKQMRDTSEEGGLFPGDRSDTYGGMFDMYFGQFLAEHGGLGLTDFVNQSLTTEDT
ncbi:MAG: rod-binding protein [Planctomycetaceae bacterium]